MLKVSRHTQRRISCEFSDLRGIGEIPIRSVVYYIMVEESTSTNGLKRLVLCIKFIIAVGKIEVSDLHKTF